MSDNVRAAVDVLAVDVAARGVPVRRVDRVPSLDDRGRLGFDLTTMGGNVVEFTVSPLGEVELI